MNNNINNKRLIEGNKTEKFVAKFMKQHKYWATILPKKSDGGQPCDVVAAKAGSSTWLIDAKHVREEEASFPFDRIEPNQASAFQYATGFAGLTNVGFAIFFERDKQLYWLSYFNYMHMFRLGCKSVNMKELPKLEEVLGVLNENSHQK